MLIYSLLSIERCKSVWIFILFSYVTKKKSDELARTTGAANTNDGC